MRLHVHFQTGDIKVDEIVEGATAEIVTAKMQARVAQEVGFIVGTILKRMSPLQFAQEAIRRYNEATNGSAPIPQTCDEFLAIGIKNGFATPLAT